VLAIHCDARTKAGYGKKNLLSAVETPAVEERALRNGHSLCRACGCHAGAGKNRVFCSSGILFLLMRRLEGDSLLPMGCCLSAAWASCALEERAKSQEEFSACILWAGSRAENLCWNTFSSCEERYGYWNDCRALVGW